MIDHMDKKPPAASMVLQTRPVYVCRELAATGATVSCVVYVDERLAIRWCGKHSMRSYMKAEERWFDET